MSDHSLDFVCSKIRETLSQDQEASPKKKPKTSAYKSVACAALEIAKMGEARWTMILDYGVKNSYFYLSDDRLTISLAPAEAVEAPSSEKSDDDVEEVEELPEMDSKGYYPDEYVRGSSTILKSSTTRPKDPDDYVLADGTPAPKKGDVVWVCGSNGPYKGEVKEVHFGVSVFPVEAQDGHWGYYNADELYDSKKQAQVCYSPKGMNWSTKAMSQTEYAQFREYQANRDEFLRWKKEQGLPSIAPTPVEAEPAPVKRAIDLLPDEPVSEPQTEDSGVGLFDDL